jgi:hypothetical protein
MCHLHRLQVAHVAADARSHRTGLEALRVSVCLAGDGRRELSRRRVNLESFALSLHRLALGGGETCVRRGASVRSGSNDSAATRVRRGVDRHDRDRVDPAFRDLSSALVYVAQPRCGRAPSDEQALGVDEPERILGPTLEHRVQGPHIQVSLSSLRVVVWAALGHPRWVSGERRRSTMSSSPFRLGEGTAGRPYSLPSRERRW